jgi:hypothetical protein
MKLTRFGGFLLRIAKDSAFSVWKGATIPGLKILG